MIQTNQNIETVKHNTAYVQKFLFVMKPWGKYLQVEYFK